MLDDGYSICLNRWALDKDIKSELGLLLIISSLTAENGFCFASNDYFAKLFDIDEVSISRKIKKLEEKGYISIFYQKRGGEVVKREIRLTKMLTDDLQKSQPTINKNVKDNNISINITSNNKETYKESFTAFWDSYPKQRAGSKEKAYTSFCRAIKEKRVTEEQLLKAVKVYANSEEVKRGFAKGCSAWLNDDRFNTDYGESKKEFAEMTNLEKMASLRN